MMIAAIAVLSALAGISGLLLGFDAVRFKQVEVARLEPWQVISRSQERSEGFVKFKAEAFYQNYS